MNNTPDSLAAQIEAVFNEFAGRNDFGVPYLQTYLEGFTHIARALIARADALERQAVPSAYAYIYEWDGPFGVHQSLSSARWNSKAPDRSVPVYLASSPPAPAQPDPLEALTREQERLGLYDDQFAAPSAPAQSEVAEPVADEREAFEEWWDNDEDPTKWPANTGWSSQKVHAYMAWQARAALASQPTAQGEPLTDTQLGAMWVTARRNSPEPHREFARAIEAAHHIGRKA